MDADFKTSWSGRPLLLDMVQSPSSIDRGGRFGRNLARVAHDSGEYLAHLGSRSLDPDDIKLECPNAILHNEYETALQTSRIVILAVPRKLVKPFVAINAKILAGKIVVELSNPSEFLQNRKYDQTLMYSLTRDFPQISFVKCFNTISSESLQSYEYPVGFSGEAFVCGDDERANREVLVFVRDLGIPGRMLGRAEKTRFVESFAAHLMNEWRLALWIALITFLVFYTYSVVYFCLQDLLNWARFVLIFEAVFGQVALNLVALTYLPGTLSQILVYKNIENSKPVILDRWLFTWMRVRAKLGTLSVGFGLLHAVFALYSVTYRRGVTPITRELAAFFAIIGLACGCILVILGIPGVSPLVSYREWRFFQRYFGWTYLVFGVAHVCLLFGQFWVAGSPLYFQGAPPSSLIACCIPFLVIFLKICVLIYIGIQKGLHKRRQAKKAERTSSDAGSVKSWWSSGAASRR